MNDETVTDALLREFLLGQVSDEDRERIEGLFLTDPHARERALGVEQDLIEDYLEDTLSAGDRERFVARFAQTAEQRRKLRISKSIKDWAMTQAAPTVAAPRRARIWQRPYALPIAAAILIAVVIAAFWLSRRWQHATIESELAQLNAPSNTSNANVQRELSPVTVRGAGPQAQLSPAARGVVELRLLLIQKESYSTYHVTLHRVDDRESYTVPNVAPSSDGKAVPLLLPARFLTRGVWQITLFPSGDEYQLTVGD